MHINQHRILHCVDEATHFQSATILRSMKSEYVWKALVKCWTSVYLGPPDFLRVDQGSNFISKEFQSAAETNGISILEAPIECPETMSHVERYHSPLRAAFNKIQHHTRGMNADEILRLSVKAVNDTTGPEGLCPTLLVFGAIPKPARNTPSPTQIERAKSIEDAMTEVSKVHARTRLQFGMKYKGPVGGEKHDLDNLFPGSLVLVYRNTTKSWEGPYKFIDKEGETVCVQLPHGRRIFRSKAVKPAPVPNIENLQVQYHIDEETVFSNINPSDDDFSLSRKKELEGLQRNGVFKVVPLSDVPATMRIYKTGWVDSIKKDEKGQEYKKSRLVARNYRDAAAKSVPTNSPTVTRWAQRLAINFAACCPERDPYLRDISQAYIQSESPLDRPVYLHAPAELDLPSGYVLQAIKPLYGIPESGLYWFETYHSHHIQRLRMTPTSADQCLLFSKDKSTHNIPNLVALQVDDSFGIVSKDFLQLEEAEVKQFKCKPRTILLKEKSVRFNGSQISRKKNNMYELKQSEMFGFEDPSTNEEFVSIRAKLQYIAGCTRPDIAGPVQILASESKNPTDESFSKLKKIIKYCKDSRNDGLQFIDLDISTMRILLFTDAAFANISDLSSQMGFLIALQDANGRCNIVHYGSARCRRVTRSIMAAELLALVYGFDQAYVIKHTLEKLLSKTIPIDALIDSRTVFNTVAKGKGTLEKRLLIDVSALRQSHYIGELRSIGWINGKENPADGLTREVLLKEDHPLKKMMRSNFYKVQPTGWASTTAIE